MKARAKLPKSGGGAKKKAKAAAGVGKATTAPTPQEANSTAFEDREESPHHETTAAAEVREGEEGKGVEQQPTDLSQERTRMLQRHKDELREVKKTRGKPKPELKRMEHELRAKQQAELHALDRQLAAQRPKPVPKPLSSKAESDDDDESSSEETPREESGDAAQPDQQKGPKKPSRAARRKQKRETEEREREKRIEEERKNAGPSAKALEIRRLMEKLGPKGFRIAEVAADGNCLYSAVGDQVKRLSLSGPHSIVELRRLAADYILDHPDDFLPFLIAEEELPPQGLKKYCDELKRDGVWGGQLELRALAQSLKVPIVVHSADAPELKMGEEFVRDPLQLTYHRHYYALGEHYNSVVAGELEE